MKVKEGDILISNVTGETFTVGTILRSKDEKKRVLVGVQSLDQFYHKQSTETPSKERAIR